VVDDLHGSRSLHRPDYPRFHGRAVPPEKQARLAKARNAVLVLIILSVIFLAGQIVLRYRHH
jgi:hypothetical protein